MPPPILPRVPEKTCIYAIGDIHGRLDLLKAIHEKISEDAKDLSSEARKIIIYLGDYMDRGLHSKKVLDLLIESPLVEFETIHLKGNHEQKMLDFLDDSKFGKRWLNLGGGATIYSYGVRVPNDVHATKRYDHIQEELKKHVPEAHLKFLKGLRTSYISGDYLFAHAGIDPAKSLDKQLDHDFIWSNPSFLKTTENFSKIIVHGHTIGTQPVIKPNRICIDTGAYLSGALTCLVLKDKSVRFLSTGQEELQVYVSDDEYEE